MDGVSRDRVVCVCGGGGGGDGGVCPQDYWTADRYVIAVAGIRLRTLNRLEGIVHWNFLTY